MWNLGFNGICYSFCNTYIGCKQSRSISKSAEDDTENNIINFNSGSFIYGMVTPFLENILLAIKFSFMPPNIHNDFAYFRLFSDAFLNTFTATAYGGSKKFIDKDINNPSERVEIAKHATVLFANTALILTATKIPMNLILSNWSWLHNIIMGTPQISKDLKTMAKINTVTDITSILRQIIFLTTHKYAEKNKRLQTCLVIGETIVFIPFTVLTLTINDWKTNLYLNLGYTLISSGLILSQLLFRSTLNKMTLKLGESLKKYEPKFISYPFPAEKAIKNQEPASSLVNCIDKFVKAGDLVAGIIKKIGRAGTLGWFAAKKETKCFTFLIITEAINLAWNIIVLLRDLLQFGYKFCGPDNSDGCCIEPEDFWKSLLHTKKSVSEILYGVSKRILGVSSFSAMEWAMISALCKGSKADINTTAFIVALILDQVPQLEISKDIIDILNSINGCESFNDCWSAIYRCFGKEVKKIEGRREWFKKFYDTCIHSGLSVSSINAFIAGFALLKKDKKISTVLIIASAVLYAIHGTADTVKLGKKVYKLVSKTSFKKARENAQKREKQEMIQPFKMNNKKNKCCPCLLWLRTKALERKERASAQEKTSKFFQLSINI
jgi:hypothetical protein